MDMRQIDGSLLTDVPLNAAVLANAMEDSPFTGSGAVRTGKWMIQSSITTPWE
jgi:hypothetical protein